MDCHYGYLDGIQIVIQYLQMQAASSTQELVTATAPMLPLSDLTTGTLFPHLFCVVKAARVLAIPLQGKVLVLVYKNVQRTI